MKKLLSLLLALVMMMNLCACGEIDTSDDNDKKGNGGLLQEKDDEEGGEKLPGEETDIPEETLPAEPTDEEKHLLYCYMSIVTDLDNYVTSGRITYERDVYDGVRGMLEGEAALSACYKLLQSMDAVDKWAGTEYADADINWDRQAVLDSFTVLEDVKLRYVRVDEDNLGNKGGEQILCEWKYYEDGQIKQITEEENLVRVHMGTNQNGYVDYASGEREYDDQGRLVKITRYDRGNVVEICEFTYDEQGKLIKQLVRQNTSQWEIDDFTYDEEGRLVRFTLPFGGDDGFLEMVYTYNEDGTLAAERKDDYAVTKDGEKILLYRYLMEYGYDTTGKVISGAYTQNEYHTCAPGASDTYLRRTQTDTYVYNYDAEGRLVTEVATIGDKIEFDVDGESIATQPSNFATSTYETVYGDYCLDYNPAK